MMDFGQWFAKQGEDKRKLTADNIQVTVDGKVIEPYVEELAEGVWDNGNGQYFIDCCVCHQACDVTEYVAANEIPMKDYQHYCGGSPLCCP